jgi:MFS family permease
MGDWRLCFLVSGLFCISYGIAFVMALDGDAPVIAKATKSASAGFAPNWRLALGAMLLSTASGGFIFGAMTFVVPRYFEISLPDISTSVAVTGLLASLVYACASFSQIGVGWLIDRVPPKWVLMAVGIGQVIFVALAARYTDYALFFAMLIAMCFVFGQIPITDTILSRYVPDDWRARMLSVKFMINLSIGASVLPICGVILQNGYAMSSLFSVMSGFACLVVLAGVLLPVQSEAHRLDKVPVK